MQVAKIGLDYDDAVIPACPGEVHLSTLYGTYQPTGVVEVFAHASEDRKPGPGTAKETEAALQAAPTHFAIRISVKGA